MKTLREKIEALTRFANGPRSVEFVKLYDVLRIVAEHEQRTQAVATGYTRAQLAEAVDAAHDHLHGDRIAAAHDALHKVGGGFPRTGCATHDPEAQRIVAELMQKLNSTGLPCGHRLADLIGGTDTVTKCGACLLERQQPKGGGEPARDSQHVTYGLNVNAPPVGQAGGEPWRKGLPDVRLRRAWEFWECKLDGRWTSRLLEDRDLQLSKAGDYWRPLNKTWSEVEQMARDADGGSK